GGPIKRTQPSSLGSNCRAATGTMGARLPATAAHIDGDWKHLILTSHIFPLTMGENFDMLQRVGVAMDAASLRTPTTTTMVALPGRRSKPYAISATRTTEARGRSCSGTGI
ncbi:Unknown protein, partial [Striga hermonthica]